MNKEDIEESVAGIDIKIITKGDGRVIVEISEVDDGYDFKDMMCACEFLLHKTAQLSNAGYEKALDLLCKGAMTYKELEKDAKDGSNNT